MKKIILLGLAFLLPQKSYALELTGDPVAIERVDKMLETIGGRTLWAEARSLYVVEVARQPNFGTGIVAKFWRDLTTPQEWYQMDGENVQVTSGWNETEGWLKRDERPRRDFPVEEMEERHFYFHREIYTLYHQLAARTADLSVEQVGIQGFLVKNHEGEKIGEFHLTPEGDLYLWKQFGGPNPVSYVYGPHRNFGEASFPDWGTNLDGSWSFYYVELRLSPDPIPFNVIEKGRD